MQTIKGITFFLSLCWLTIIFPHQIFGEQGQDIDLGPLKLSVDIDNGFAVKKEFNIDTPFLKVHRKSEIGIGDPMVKYSEESDEDSDERRRKREVQRSARKKRTPCHTQTPSGGGSGGGGGDAGGGGDGGTAEEARRRRKRKMNTMRKKKKKSGRRRRRRETNISDFADEAKDFNKNFGERVGQVAQGIHNFFDKVLNSTQQIMQRVTATFNGDERKQEAGENI